MPLSEIRRSQLDGIVQSMVQNKEPDNNIQFVVNDFKNKYENENAAAQPAVEPSGGVFQNLADKAGQILKGGSDVLIGAAKGVGSTLLGASELGQEALGKIVPSAVGSVEFTKQAKEKYTTPVGSAQKLGFGAEQIGEFFTPVGGVGKLSKISKVAKFALGTAGETLKSGALGSIQAGDIKGGYEAGLANLIGAGVGGTIGRGAKKLGEYSFYRTIPTSIKEMGQDLRKSLQIGEAVSKTGISLTRKSLVKKVEQRSSDLGIKLGGVIDDFAAKNPTATHTIDDILSSVDNSLADAKIAKEMKISPVDVPIAREAVAGRLDQYRKLYGEKELNFSDLQKLKVELGPELQKTYRQALDAPVKAKILADINLQGQLRKVVADAIPEADAINKKLAPLLEARTRLGAKGLYSGLLTDTIVGGIAAGNMVDILDDPVGYMKRFATGVVFKRLGTSTAAKTTAGTLLKHIESITQTPQFYQILRKASNALGKKYTTDLQEESVIE